MTGLLGRQFLASVSHFINLYLTFEIGLILISLFNDGLHEHRKKSVSDQTYITLEANWSALYHLCSIALVNNKLSIYCIFILIYCTVEITPCVEYYCKCDMNGKKMKYKLYD